MEAKSIVIGSLLFITGVAVGMHGARMAHEMHHMHHGHGHGPHMVQAISTTIRLKILAICLM